MFDNCQDSVSGHTVHQHFVYVLRLLDILRRGGKEVKPFCLYPLKGPA